MGLAHEVFAAVPYLAVSADLPPIKVLPYPPPPLFPRSNVARNREGDEGRVKAGAAGAQRRGPHLTFVGPVSNECLVQRALPFGPCFLRTLLFTGHGGGEGGTRMQVPHV